MRETYSLGVAGGPSMMSFWYLQPSVRTRAQGTRCSRMTKNREAGRRMGMGRESASGAAYFRSGAHLMSSARLSARAHTRIYS
eukprot:scaffold5074_cov127-Isochrysis_galbana.AAC.2